MLQFAKMHGLGNDFMVVDGISQPVTLDKKTIQQWANRHSGVGFDQLLLLQPAKDADIGCVIYNADGSEAEQCGNGMRCVARYVHEKKLVDKKNLVIATKAGKVNAVIEDYDTIHVAIGIPQFEPSLIPFQADQIRSLYEIPLDDGQPGLALSVLSLGNPHAILQVSSVKQFPVAKFGPLLATHRFFPRGANVGFMEIVTPQHIRLRTFERGAGETLACGSNACAAVIAGIKNKMLEHEVKVELKLGALSVKWEDEQKPVVLTGPTSWVFEGTL